jgi:hypothetical protein
MHGFVGKPMEKKANDAEAYDLGKKMRPVHTEGIGNLLDLPTTRISCRNENQSIHK